MRDMKTEPSSSIASDARTEHPNQSKPELLVLLCTYNEAENLPSLVPAIVEVVPSAHMLIVDDASPDGTGRWARDHQEVFPLTLIERSGKQGLGSAIRFGLQWAIDHDFTWILNMDADWSHHPSQMKRLLDARFSHQTRQDLVIGSRYVEGGGMIGCSWRRKLVSRGVNFMARWMLGMNVHDFSSAYRCYHKDCLKSLRLDQIRCDGYGFLEELLFAIHQNGGAIFEVPITYEERRLGKSKLSLREAYSAASTLTRLGFRRLRGQEVDSVQKLPPHGL